MQELPSAEAGQSIAARLEAVRSRVADAARRSGRDPSAVSLVAVSKRQPAQAIEAAYAAGQRLFGENYAQELVAKADALGHLGGIVWHAIGALQTNKARDVARVAAMVETVDRIALADKLEARAAELGRVLPVLIEVNVGDEASKSGCSVAELPRLVDHARGLGHLALRGLMAIVPAEGDPRPHFARLRALRDAHLGAEAELSMGMSGDYETAIEEGATIVRVGTAIFGTRGP